jgi:hypothetical protein
MRAAVLCFLCCDRLRDRGFEPIEIPLRRQPFIVMSTQVGKTALDGAEGMGSSFARAFDEVIPTPGGAIQHCGE